MASVLPDHNFQKVQTRQIYIYQRVPVISSTLPFSDFDIATTGLVWKEVTRCLRSVPDWETTMPLGIGPHNTVLRYRQVLGNAGSGFKYKSCTVCTMNPKCMKMLIEGELELPAYVCFLSNGHAQHNVCISRSFQNSSDMSAV